MRTLRCEPAHGWDTSDAYRRREGRWLGRLPAPSARPSSRPPVLKGVVGWRRSDGGQAGAGVRGRGSSPAVGSADPELTRPGKIVVVGTRGGDVHPGGGRQDQGGQ